MKVMFVCTGNTCRSPMAEIFTKSKLKGSSVEVISRGLFVFSPEKASAQAGICMEKRKLTLNNHLSKALDVEDIISSDIILTMTSAHKNSIIIQYPEHKDKVHTLKEFTIGKNQDIIDPFGQNDSVYESCATEILECIEILIHKLETLA